MASEVVFRSKRVITGQGVGPATLVVRGGKIAAIGGWADLAEGIELRDFGDHVLLPGLVDTHVHINDPGRSGWEGFATASQAAASGGVTTLVDMPLNCIPETVSAEALEAKRAAATGRTWVDWMAWGGVVGNGGLGGNEAGMPALIAAGVPGFKCFLVHSGIEGFAWVDGEQLRKALAVLRDWNSGGTDISGGGDGQPGRHGHLLPLLAHAEVAGPVDEATRMISLGRVGDGDWRHYATYLASRPDAAELQAIELLIKLAHEFATPIHIVHLATAEALPALRKARAAGLKISVETCPQYLWFAAEEIPDGATEFKCAPPIRGRANREALWQALLDGEIDLIATDHSPCSPELKDRDAGRFDRAWGGIAGLGLALPLVWTGLQGRSASSGGSVGAQAASKLVLLGQWLAAAPARLAGLTGQKGALAVGYDADIVVFDPEREWTVTEADLHFCHKLSPYLGERVMGRVVATYLRGERIFEMRALGSNFASAALGRELRAGRNSTTRQEP